MRIGIDASRANTSERSGIENYSLQMIVALAHVDKLNEFILYMREEPIEELSNLPSNFTVKVLKPSRILHLIRKFIALPPLWTHTALARELKSSPVDVLFVPGHVLPWSYRGKAVLTVHDIGFHYAPQVYSRQQRLYLDIMTKRDLRKAARVLTVSSKTRQDVIAVYGLTEEKLKVINPGIERALYFPQENIRRGLIEKRYNLLDPYFLFVGNLIPKKGLETLLEAFGRSYFERTRETLMRQANGADPAMLSKKLGKSHPLDAMQLVLVGHGDEGYIRELRSLAEANFVGDRVHILGYIPSGDIALLMNFCVAYVQPSIYEGFGMPVVDAMACGAPVIVSDSGALVEVGGDAGLMFKRGDSDELARYLTQVATDESLREQLKIKSLQFSMRYDWDKAAQELMVVLGEVAGGGLTRDTKKGITKPNSDQI